MSGKTLQEILEKTLDQYYRAGLEKGRPLVSIDYLTPMFVSDIAQDLHDALMEIVGEDEVVPHIVGTLPDVQTKALRDELRAELRQAIKEWTGVE